MRKSDFDALIKKVADAFKRVPDIVVEALTTTTSEESRSLSRPVLIVISRRSTRRKRRTRMASSNIGMVTSRSITTIGRFAAQAMRLRSCGSF